MSPQEQVKKLDREWTRMDPNKKRFIKEIHRAKGIKTSRVEFCLDVTFPMTKFRVNSRAFAVEVF
jgi:hypothetical protein